MTTRVRPFEETGVRPRLAFGLAVLLHVAALAAPFARSDVRAKPVLPLHVQLASAPPSVPRMPTALEEPGRPERRGRTTQTPVQKSGSPLYEAATAATPSSDRISPVPSNVAVGTEVVRQTIEKVNPEREVASSSSGSHSVQPLPASKTPEASASASKPAGIPTINGIDYESAPVPVYPALSRRLRETGRTTLRVLVGVDGRPERVELHSSSGSEALDRAAFEATARAIFRPYRESGKPVQAWTIVPIRFSLD